MALICLLLFVALVAFSTGFSFRNYINERLGKGATPVDVTVKSQDEKVTDILDRNGYKVDEWAEDYFEIPIYYGDQVTMGTLAGNYLDEAKQMFRLAKWGSPEGVMKVSDYNILERKFGREEVKLEGNQYVIISDFELLNQFSNKAMADNNFVTISGIDYYPAESAAREEFMMLSGIGANLGVVIFPDEVICEENGFTAGAYLLAADYKVKDRADRLEVDDILEDKLGIEIDEDGDVVGSVYMTTKNAVVDTSTGTTVMVVFIVLYIGIVFIMACAAILALRILSDSIDSVKKYEILSRIGVTKHMQRRALFVQVLLNFLLPLLLATLHTYFGALYLKELFRALGFIKVSGGLLFTVIIMVVVYGGYFITTYVNCKHVINLD